MDVRSVELGQEYPLSDEPALIAEIADLTLRAARFMVVSMLNSRYATIFPPTSAAASLNPEQHTKPKCGSRTVT